MNYTQKELVRIAKRENNTKRGYLVVNPMQGKHIAVSPTKALELFQNLAMEISGKYAGETLLVIGFAETATAIGAQVAVSLNAQYMQTTREAIAGVEYLFFTEAHSHATEQKLIKDDVDRVIDQVDRIVFVEDEVTTGNTIMNIIRLLNATYRKPMGYTILSLLNGMGEESLKRCEEEKIDLHYLVKTDHSSYEEKAARFTADGTCVEADSSPVTGDTLCLLEGWMNARRLVSGKQYGQACEKIADALLTKLSVSPQERVLVMGTEEFMYPALYVGSRLEQLGCTVRSHSTTRSPIAVSTDPAYPLHVRYALESPYDSERRTFVYDIGNYDRVIILTDSDLQGNHSLNSLIHAVKRNNGKVNIARWY